MASLYLRLIAAKIRSQMQYKASFALELVGFTLTTGIEFAVVAILLGRFGEVGGWGLGEVALLYGLSSVSFGIAEMVARGFDSPFERMMRAGAFDGVLIRPLGAFMQIFASEFQLRRLGRVAQGGAALAFALSHGAAAPALVTAALVLIAIASGALIYAALIVMGATVCFWTIKTPEVINVLTVGGQAVVSYPLSIYNRFIRVVFLSVVPVAVATYPAALLILGRADPHGIPGELAWAAPLVALGFFGLARLFWGYGVTKYQSTGT